MHKQSQYELQAFATITWTDMCDLPAKVTEFQDTSLRIKEKILRFDIPVTYTISVDICQWTEQLIHVELGREDEEKKLHIKNMDVLQLE